MIKRLSQQSQTEKTGKRKRAEKSAEEIPEEESNDAEREESASRSPGSIAESVNAPHQETIDNPECCECL